MCVYVISTVIRRHICFDETDQNFLPYFCQISDFSRIPGEGFIRKEQRVLSRLVLEEIKLMQVRFFHQQVNP